jgi:TetR/AcrR family transcriptional regulator, transcriptional repressor of aconitase
VPKVSAAHLAARRAQILAAARRCFARDGFHRATMHDVVREAGLSAGAVYRYFASKEALIEALARERHERERAALASAAEEGDAAAALRALARAFVGGLGSRAEREDRRLGIQLWAEALREPRLARVVREGVRAPRREIGVVLRRAQRRGELPASVDPDAGARLAVAVFHGIVLQQAWEPSLDVDALAAALEAAAAALAAPRASKV